MALFVSSRVMLLGVPLSHSLMELEKLRVLRPSEMGAIATFRGSHDLCMGGQLVPKGGRLKDSGPLKRMKLYAMLYSIIMEKIGKKIAECFPGRTDVQCLHRWQKVLNPDLVKGPWSMEEDEIIIEMVNKFGPKKWSSIAQALPGRVGKQCRERWHNHLNPSINKEAWTQDEEIALIHAHQIYGNKWAELTKFLPGRSDNSIKNHWNSSVKKKVDSYVLSGLLPPYPGTNNHISSTTTGQQKSINENGVEERYEIEESSECGSSALRNSTGFECEMAEVVAIGELKKEKDTIKMDVSESRFPASSAEHNCSAEGATSSVPEVQCEKSCGEVHSSGKLLQNDEGIEDIDEQSAQTETDHHDKKVVLLCKTASLEKPSSTSGFEPARDQFFISSPDGSSGIFLEAQPNSTCPHNTVTALSVVNSDYITASTSKSDVQSSGNFMNFAPCYSLFPVSTSDVYAITCQGLMAVIPPSFNCSSDDAKSQEFSGGQQCLGPIASSLYGLSNFSCPMPTIPEQRSSSAKHLNQLKEFEVQEEKQIVEETNKGAIPSKLSLADEKKDVQEEKFLDSGSLFYEPPRIQSLEFPFVSCDIVSNDLHQAYSPLGIRQLMMSSASCNLWDSPHDDNPDNIFKHAAKSFICTPSIMKKRQRELLSPLQESNSVKKSGSMSQPSLTISTNKCYVDDFLCEVGSERTILSSVDNVLDHPSSNQKSRAETSKQNEGLGAKMAEKNKSIISIGCGSMVQSVTDLSIREPHCGGVLMECNYASLESQSSYATFISPNAFGSKCGQHFIKVASLQNPPSTKKPQIAIEKFTSSTDDDIENLNM
ncbi:hypothetical protein HPP92_003545 [Vanilla planifolia]|uniref:Uncharacterized protein n=1 Tax=Vanilla planifolia TaxID=51239 RepID=A0A835S6E9_VANPL|nr:hypothetical protein HPP92_003545 [Vanilla planifolia]